MSKTRTVRLSDDEDRQIELFLEANPFFDFSSLARVALTQFIRNPNLHIQAVLPEVRSEASSQKVVKQ